MMKAKEAEQICIIDESRTKEEEENLEEHRVVKYQLDWWKKQYDTICKMWAGYRTEDDRMTKDEENIEEDVVVDDQLDWMQKQWDKICQMNRTKKQYDSIRKIETAYKTEHLLFLV